LAGLSRRMLKRVIMRFHSAANVQVGDFYCLNESYI
jgi:hypothetical protein